MAKDKEPDWVIGGLALIFGVPLFIQSVVWLVNYEEPEDTGPAIVESTPYDASWSQSTSTFDETARLRAERWEAEDRAARVNSYIDFQSEARRQGY